MKGKKEIMKHGEASIVNILIQKGKELLNEPPKRCEFTKNIEADNLLNDLAKYPHAFVLACIMDRQIRAERAWLIPFEISEEIGSFQFSDLLKLNLLNITEIFKRNNLHRFNDVMARNMYQAIQRIHINYEDDASNIWKNSPSSATVVRRFIEFKGVGVKIATMATNTLARDFKIQLKDHICIDISPDIHVKRVFKRLGFISDDAGTEEMLYRAKELNPGYPGIFDLPCWQIGRQWCRPKNPLCIDCYLNGLCPKNCSC